MDATCAIQESIHTYLIQYLCVQKTGYISLQVELLALFYFSILHHYTGMTKKEKSDEIHVYYFTVKIRERRTPKGKAVLF